MKKIKQTRIVDAGGMGGGTKAIEVVSSIEDDAPVPPDAVIVEDDAE